mgnify:CR=1 FL=1
MFIWKARVKNIKRQYKHSNNVFESRYIIKMYEHSELASAIEKASHKTYVLFRSFRCSQSLQASCLLLVVVYAFVHSSFTNSLFLASHSNWADFILWNNKFYAITNRAIWRFALSGLRALAHRVLQYTWHSRARLPRNSSKYRGFSFLYNFVIVVCTT